MAAVGKCSSSIIRGVMFLVLVITLFGGINAFGISEDLDNYIDVIDDYVDDQIHHALYPNENALMKWGIGVFVAIIVGIVVAVVLICVCCGCMCYHCCCKTSPPPYTTLVVASNQPHPMAQPTQMNMQPPPFAQQPSYAIKN